MFWCLNWTGETEFAIGIGETKEKAFLNLFELYVEKYNPDIASRQLNKDHCDFIEVPENTKAFFHDD